jgi:hypothetical protein
MGVSSRPYEADTTHPEPDPHVSTLSGSPKQSRKTMREARRILLAG